MLCLLDNEEQCTQDFELQPPCSLSLGSAFNMFSYRTISLKNNQKFIDEIDFVHFRKLTFNLGLARVPKDPLGLSGLLIGPMVVEI
jgi:hypothetical protein